MLKATPIDICAEFENFYIIMIIQSKHMELVIWLLSNIIQKVGLWVISLRAPFC